jgi:hypothetical protein
MDADSQRGRDTQRMFLRANRRFFDALSNSTCPDGDLIPFVCECADGDCVGRVEITSWRYEDIHAKEDHYVILPGHMRIGGEEIMEENAYYEIVKKAA